MCPVKYSIYTLALVAPLLALGAPVPEEIKATQDADAESFFLQTDFGWFDGGDSKKREASIEQ
ncbi:uncharacterized protein ColSpa_00477 [Colletotrichum spaethianum]|uniref:Uncharacterized protein n=1 Tax=Colletotrichum spaethianum TaxID=700344 RepID=A0AA37P452_9PEZI|nr:uncharacterized protein ColSpa_00477 [Colletotrichum spaethianum]GKT40296.1 hypothetical protein ColSpa_00477 [Colletotrichum spaethianum]